MKKLSTSRLAQVVSSKRKELNLTQRELSEKTGINRSLLSRLEQENYYPLIPQLESLGDVLGFELDDVFINSEKSKINSPSPLKIAVAGMGYVGLSIAILLAQHNHVTAIDIIPEKVDMINNQKSPLQDEYIEKYLNEKELDLTATLNEETAYKNADFIVIAVPTNYDSKKNHFDTSAVETVIENVMKINPDAVMVIKSTIPVGYTESVRKKYNTRNIIFSPEFLRESKALYDNLYPSRIIVSTDSNDEKLVKAANNGLTISDNPEKITFPEELSMVFSGIMQVLQEGASMGDVLLNIYVIAYRRGIDLKWHIEQKMKYNEERPYKHNKKY